MKSAPRIVFYTFIFLSMLPVQNSFASGTSGAAVLKQQIGARATGMGDTFTAIADDIYTIQYNPAGLVNIPNREFSMMYVKGIVDTSQGFFGYAKNTKRMGVWGISWFDMQMGDIDLGDKIVKTQQDNVFALSYALNISRYLALGANAKYVTSTLLEEYSAKTYAYDFGGLFRPNIKGLTLGFSVLNNGQGMKYIEIEDPLPLLVRTGAAYRYTFNKDSYLLMSGDILTSNDDTVKQNIGVEVSYKNTLMLRFGNKIGYSLESFTFGLGFMLNGFQMDISHTLMGTMDSLERVSLTLKSFGGTPTQAEVQPEQQTITEQEQVQPELQTTSDDKTFDKDLNEEIEKDLVPVYEKAKKGYYFDSSMKLYSLIEENPERSVDWTIHYNKFSNVALITAEITGTDRTSELIRKGLLDYLKPNAKPKNALNKLYYAWETTKSNVAKKLYTMIKEQYPNIAKEQEVPQGFTFVSYKLFQALNNIYDGKYDLAINLSNDVLQVEPENVVALKRLGSALYALGKAENKPDVAEQGRQVWRKALKLSPSDTEIKEFLKKE
ncbi:MAG: hypothetical protein A3J83_00175 [Elusimicrobia bacterium RIFOXYA2_FULL_40_6]|nr:MAG: hypothetical protein A3J83_00175 [Elusimicrobia bacterium RIFOXYA2_FULL_40_6]